MAQKWTLLMNKTFSLQVKLMLMIFKLNEMTYVVFDIETTGLSRTRDRVIEIGATKIKSGQVVDRFQTFVDPQMKISSFITNLTGIFQMMI